MSELKEKVKLKKGDTLICKIRGRVEVTMVNEDGFYVKYRDSEYFHPYTDIGKLFILVDRYNQNKEKNKNRFKLRNYKDCVIDKERIDSDPVYKEEAINLCKTLNIISTKLNDLITKGEKIDRTTRLPACPTHEERLEWLSNADKWRKTIKKIDKLKIIIEKPYFARVDIKSEKGEKSNIYVGENGITHNSVDIVYDWRSRLGQRYYKRNELGFELANISYRTELIRNIDIKKMLLWDYENDYLIEGEAVTNAVSDPFLIKILKEKRNTKVISNIISSIQESQNNIITRNLNENIIVQGCAGSGKTMILLHRLSYLIYNNELDLDRIKIITHNNLFKRTINNLAKELQVNEIDRLCIEEYFLHKLEEYGFKLKGKLSKHDISDEMYKYIYSKEFKISIEIMYNKYIESLWKNFDDNQFNYLIKKYNILDNTIEEEQKNFKNLQYYIRRINEEFFKREKEYNNKKNKYISLKEKLIETEKIISLIKQKKEFLEGLKTNFIELNSIEEKEMRNLKLELGIKDLTIIWGINLNISINEIEEMLDVNSTIEQKYNKISEEIDSIIKIKDNLEEIKALRSEEKKQGLFSIRRKRELKDQLHNLYNITQLNPKTESNIINNQIIDLVGKLEVLNNKIKNYKTMIEKKELLKGLLNLKEISSESIETEIENLISNLEDYNKEKLLVESIEKELKIYRKENFLDMELTIIKKQIKKIMVLTEENLNFIESKIYNPLLKEVSKIYGYKDYTMNNRMKLYCLLNIMFIHKGKLNKEDKMICFDEGQDINYFEYSLIKKINGDKVIFNILGDVNQLTNKLRGIDNWNKLQELDYFQRFNINKNYRNSQNVTNYCIKATGYKMIPVGVDDGEIYEVYENDEEFKKVINRFIKDSSIRKAVIIRELDEETKILLGNSFKGYSLNIISEENNVLRLDRINILTVSMAKGMEFDSTLIFTNGMNNNEKYISLTRALINNYIILN